MESESCIITTKNRFINQSSSLHFEQKISLNGHCDDNGLPPPSPSSNNNSQQLNQNTANEHKRWSTSYSKKTGVIDSTTSSQHQQFDQDDCNLKLPSYVGISCTISGYSNYSRYCSSVRGSYSRGSSPIMRNYEVMDGPNVVQHNYHHHFHHQQLHHHNNNHLDSSTTSSERQSFISPINNNNSTITNNWSKEDNGFISGGISNHTRKNNNDLICGDLDYDDDTSGSSEKSLVQRRIESLYGSNVAEVWRDSRSKVKKVNKKKIEMINNRSPSCPPHALRSKECNKKSPAVFSHLNENFLSKIDADPKTDPVNGLINSLNEILNVNGTKSNGTQQQVVSTQENEFYSSDPSYHQNHQYNNHQSINHHQNSNGHNAEKINGNNLYHHDNDDVGIDQVDKVDVMKTLENGRNNGHQNGQEEVHEVKKGEMYLKKLEETISKLKVEIGKTEKLLQDDSHLINEEITGNLLSSIGKGNLLIAQKLNQFRELCHKNINGNQFEQFSTKNEDLDGFWEMVYIQVEDVLNGFQEIYKLKRNDWIIITNNNESPTSKITQPKIRSPRKGIAKISPNQQQSNPTSRNTARDEMRKQRLREAKIKSQSRLQEMKQSDDDIVIFVPPPNTGDDSLINNNGSNTDS